MTTTSLPILVVNDDASILDSIATALRKENLYFVTADSAEDALAKAKGYDFSLAILDLHLFDMDGASFYDALMEEEAHYELPVVLPIDTFDGDEVTALNEICSRATVTVISKPIDEAKLTKLANLYGHRKG